MAFNRWRRLDFAVSVKRISQRLQAEFTRESGLVFYGLIDIDFFLQNLLFLQFTRNYSVLPKLKNMITNDHGLLPNTQKWKSYDKLCRYTCRPHSIPNTEAKRKVKKQDQKANKGGKTSVLSKYLRQNIKSKTGRMEGWDYWWRLILPISQKMLTLRWIILINLSIKTHEAMFR